MAMKKSHPCKKYFPGCGTFPSKENMIADMRADFDRERSEGKNLTVIDKAVHDASISLIASGDLAYLGDGYMCATHVSTPAQKAMAKSKLDKIRAKYAKRS